jgi:hypothetical protein
LLGVRGVAFVHGGDNVIPSSARGTMTEKQLLHAVDWIPTFVGLTNSNNKKNNINNNKKSNRNMKKEEKIPKEYEIQLPNNLDGLDIWDVLMSNANITRYDRYYLFIRQHMLLAQNK